MATFIKLTAVFLGILLGWWTDLAVAAAAFAALYAIGSALELALQTEYHFLFTDYLQASASILLKLAAVAISIILLHKEEEDIAAAAATFIALYYFGYTIHPLERHREKRRQRLIKYRKNLPGQESF